MKKLKYLRLAIIITNFKPTQQTKKKKRSFVPIRNGVIHHDGTPVKDEVLIRILEIITANISAGKYYLFLHYRNLQPRYLRIY